MAHPELQQRLINLAASNKLIDLAMDVEFKDIPKQAIESAKIFLMDTLAVSVAGRQTKGADKIFKAASAWGESNASRVIARPGIRLPSASSAFVNGYQTHCLEWDALHESSVVIAMCCPVSALVAEAEQTHCSGENFLAALIVAIEIAVLLGSASSTGPKFFRPAIAGGMAASIGISRLRGFDKQQTLDALGLTYSQIAGTMQAHWEGSMALAMQVGSCARAAICAADMTQAGATGPQDILLGKFGYFTLFETATNLDEAFLNFGKPWKMTEMAHKPYPAGRATQAALTMFRDLQTDGPFELDSIARITMRVPPLILLLVGRPLTENMSSAYARLCLKYIGPVMLLEGDIDPVNFPEGQPVSKAVETLSKRLHIELDENKDPNALGPQTCEIEFTNGTILQAECSIPYGSPGNALSKEARDAKVRRCFSIGAPDLDPEVLIAASEKVETMNDIRELTSAVYGCES